MNVAVQINPSPVSPALASRYLAGLNQAFPGWGDQARFDWCFARRSDPCPADLLTAEQDGVAIAGMAVPYREVVCGRTRQLVGIMCGAWTDPAIRRSGCFTALLEASGAVARSRGASLLTGFVRGDRPSLGALGRYCDLVGEAGFVTLPGRRGDKARAAGTPMALELARDIMAAQRVPSDMAGYAYDPSQWWEQMVAPHGAVTARRFDDGMIALIRPDAAGCSILDLVPPAPAVLIANASSLAGEFGTCTFYTCDAAVLGAARSVAARIAPAQTFFKRLGPGQLIDARWFFTDADRM